MQGSEKSLNTERFVVPNKLRKGQFREDFECQAKVPEPYSVNDREPLRREVVKGICNPSGCCYSLQGSALLSHWKLDLCSPRWGERWQAAGPLAADLEN